MAGIACPTQKVADVCWVCQPVLSKGVAGCVKFADVCWVCQPAHSNDVAAWAKFGFAACNFLRQCTLGLPTSAQQGCYCMWPRTHRLGLPIISQQGCCCRVRTSWVSQASVQQGCCCLVHTSWVRQPPNSKDVAACPSAVGHISWVRQLPNSKDIAAVHMLVGLAKTLEQQGRCCQMCRKCAA